MAWAPRLGLLLLLFFQVGCGYALVGRGVTTDPSIKRIGVPLFKDRSGRAGLDQVLTNKVIAELEAMFAREHGRSAGGTPAHRARERQGRPEQDDA